MRLVFKYFQWLQLNDLSVKLFYLKKQNSSKCVCVVFFYLKALTCARAELKSCARRLSISEWIAVSVLDCTAADTLTPSCPSLTDSASFRQLSKMASSSDMLVIYKNTTVSYVYCIQNLQPSFLQTLKKLFFFD